MTEPAGKQPNSYIPTDQDKNPVELLTEEPGKYHLSINDEGKPERVNEIAGDVWLHPSLSGPVLKPNGGRYVEMDKPSDMVSDAAGAGGRVHLALSAGLGGSKTPAPGMSPAKPPERKLTPEEMMRMATELENQYKQRTAELDYMPSSVEPTLARSETYRDSSTPPDWLTKYMETQPTTGTIAFDNNGHQKYLAHRERLRKLKQAQDR